MTRSQESHGENRSVRRRRGSRSTAIAIASSRREIVDVLADLVSDTAGFELAGNPIRNPTKLIVRLEQRGAGLLLIDRSMLDSLSAQTKRMICARLPELRVLVLSDGAPGELAPEIVRNRFHGVLVMGLAPQLWAEAIRRVTRGELWLPRAMLEQIILEYREQAETEPLIVVDAQLTARESQAVEALGRGLTNKQIARKLGIKEDTVKKHLHRAYGKLGVRSRSQLLAERSIRQPF